MRLLLILLLACPPMFAQIFPRIEKDDVQRRIQSGKPEPEKEEPGAEPAAPPEQAVDGEKAYKRYLELLERYRKDEKSIREASDRHLSKVHPSVREYLEGVVLLRLGYYRDAEKKLKAVGSTVRNEDKAPEQCRNVIRDIKSGRAYFFRMVAVVMDHWKDFETEEQMLAAWDKAYKAAEKLVNEARKEVDRKRIDNEQLPQQMNGWLLNGRLYWKNLYAAQQNVKSLPGNANTWKALVTATGGREGSRDEYTPMYLVQRAALEVAREFFQHDDLVTGGTVDAGLGWNHVATAQLDEWKAYFEPKPYLKPGGRIALGAARLLAEGLVKQLEELKTE
ncbi:MAG: hypothetical protein KF696_00355 [Planctomycetes bacterium]|nr:hypothetical protein [Planctomycetota bacterium]MCW8134610.1 hypothetical protein [Planctomycetota bacterium]